MSSIRSFSVLLFSCAGVVAFAACGSAKPAGQNSNTVAQKVGTGGGTVKLANQVTLVIPAGALDRETTIGVTSSATSPAGYELDSLRYRFSPEGLTFQQPITVRLERLQERTGQGLYWSKAAGVSGFDLLPSSVQTADGKTYLEGQTTHFSEAFIGRTTAPANSSGPTGSSNPSCGSGEASCGGTCVTLADSNVHCGACDNACTGNTTCEAGECKTQIAIKVAVGPSGEYGHSIAFSAHKVGPSWVSINPSPRDANNNVTLSFATAESNYEVLFGCTYQELGSVRAGQAFHLKKSSAASVLALDCAQEKVESPIPDLVTINATDLPDSPDAVLACGAGGNQTASSPVSKGEAQLVDLQVADSQNWAALVRYTEDTAAKFGILRNQTSQTGSFSATNSLSTETTTFTFDFDTNDSTVAELNPLYLYAYASQGDFSGFEVNLPASYLRDAEANALSIKTTTLLGLQSGEGHHLSQEFADSQGQTWAVDARFSGNPTDLSLTMPRGSIAPINNVNEEIEGEFYDHAEVQRLTAADVNILNTESESGPRWHIESDGAVSPTYLDLRVPNLSGVAGSNLNLFRTPQGKVVTATVQQRYDQGAGGGFSSRSIVTSKSATLGGK